jgi:zona occludens toxin
MIYLITGVPGSGKTLYAVSKLLQHLLAEKIKREDGSEISRRLCIDGIPNLLLPHELMAPLADASSFIENKRNAARTVDEDGKPVEAQDGHGLWNWWEWCKPGDVIVCDEVQRHWRPRGMGTKVPEQIARLETHRHYGVDFVLITQNPMLVDQNVRRLVGRHQHVRRLFGGSRALIYEWDGCQTDTSRLAGGTRTLFTYPKDAYKLYKSSELHTKQRQKIPLWFAFPLVVLAVGAVAGPRAYDALHKGAGGKGIGAQAGVATAPASAPAALAGRGASAALPPSVAASKAPGQRPDVLSERKMALMGCIAFKDRCECFDADGAKVETDRETCQDGSQRISALPLEVSHGRGSQNAPKARETDCDWVVPLGQTGAEVRCWSKDAPGPAVAQSSLPPAQGTDGATMGPRGAGGAAADGGQQSVAVRGARGPTR